MLARLPMALCALMFLLLAGCGGDVEDPRGQRVGVRGTVEWNGKPLDRARIVFSPAEGDATITATGSIVNGAYEIPAESGPLVGKMRVEIQADKIELEEFEAARGGDKRKRPRVETTVIPAKYTTQSTLDAVVTEDEAKNVFDYHLESKPK
jgi:hypothetical protein